MNGFSAVSIHAARVGRDAGRSSSVLASICFNPRGPCGPRRTKHKHIHIMWKFQSTRPVWAATCHAGIRGQWSVVSIHAARVGRDDPEEYWKYHGQVSIHAARVGRDVTLACRMLL